MPRPAADRPFRLKDYLIHALGCTVFIYAMLGLIFWLPVQFEGLNPLSDALSDFEVTDIIFSRIKEPAAADTSIVIVNFGELPTEGMADLVDRIAADKPRVIGIDAIFNNPKRDPYADSLLEAAFSRVDNLVLACKADGWNEKAQMFDSVVGPIARFRQHARLGFANFITEELEYGNTCRDFTPQLKLKGGKPLYGLATEMCRIAYPEAAQKALNRNNEVETINYARRESGYYYLDWQQVLDPEVQFNFRDKVVFMGFMGRQNGDPSILDKFFTPLNDKYAGRSIPDMYGVVVHANIFSQIKEQTFINIWPNYLGLLLGFVLVYTNVFGFYLINTKLPAWYDLLTKTIQFFESILLLYIVLVVFYYQSLHIDLTIAIGALVLSGDLLEVYAGAFPLINKYFNRLMAKQNGKQLEPTEMLEAEN